jgi:3-oxoacyl-[acyl-carrier protein] reductase
MNKVAIITGGDRGIGRSISEKLSSDGYVTAIVFNKEKALADETVNNIKSRGGKAFSVQADLGNIDQICSLFDTVQQTLSTLHCQPGIDVLVNNAGVISHQRIEDITEQDYIDITNVNIKGTLFMMKNAIPKLNNNASIINISSFSTSYASPGEALYAASKAAIEQFSKVAAKELAERFIKVNTILPGPTDTDMLRSNTSEEVIKAVIEMTPLQRLAHPKDIAELVSFLVSERNQFITGKNFLIDGGII